MIFGSWVSNAAVSIDVNYNIYQLVASFYNIRSMDFDKQNNILYIVGANNKVVKYTAASGTTEYDASAYTPYGIAVNSTSAYFSVFNPASLKKWDGAVGTSSYHLIMPGSVSTSGSDDIVANSSLTTKPKYMRISSTTGDLYFTEACRVRKISNGMVRAVAGKTTCTSSLGDGGSATNAEFNGAPYYIALTPEDDLLVMDNVNRLRKVSNGTITTILSPTSCRGLAVGTNGDIYIIGK